MKKITEYTLFGLGLTCTILTGASSRKFRFILGSAGVGLFITSLHDFNTPRNALVK